MLLSDTEVISRVLSHIDNQTTDLGDRDWQEPVENYSSMARFNAELKLMRHLPVPFCPTAALPENGSYVARVAAGVPIVVVRTMDGTIRAFRNACRHRGMQVVQGSGCAKVLKCGYHGWAYRLDGRLEHIPHDYGFPDFDKDTHGLVPVTAEVKNGLVFVTQEEPLTRAPLLDTPVMMPADYQIFDSRENTSDINWKLNIEATMEGYHIKPTHPETFYPYGYDNLNVVETNGINSRITFPFRRIEKLREVPEAERKIDRMVTYVYNIFPFASVAVLSNHTSITISEPISPTMTRFVNYKMGPARDDDAEALQRAKKDASFVADTGLLEDNAVIRAIQAGLASGANTHFTYGRFEKAIVHLHKNLAEQLQSLNQFG